MAFDTNTFIADLPQLIAFYQKLRANIDNPAAIAVAPAVNVADATDKALAIAQANVGDFIGLIRIFLSQAAKKV